MNPAVRVIRLRRPVVVLAEDLIGTPDTPRSYFMDDLYLLPCPERDRTWRVLYPVRWFSARLNRVFVIPANLIVDLFSVPRCLWWLFPPSEGRSDAAAALHDLLARYRKVLGLRYLQVHAEFLDAMEYLKTGLLARRAKWLGVVLGNWAVASPGDGTPPDELKEIQAKWPISEVVR